MFKAIQLELPRRVARNDKRHSTELHALLLPRFARTERSYPAAFGSAASSAGLSDTPASANVAMPVWQASAARRSSKRHRGAGGFAEPHVEIEERLQSQLVEQHAVAGFGGDVAGDRVRKRVGAELRSGATAAVQTKPSSMTGMP